MRKRLGPLPAKVRISKFSSGGIPHEGYSVVVTDRLSGTVVADVTMTFEEFARAIGSEGDGMAEFFTEHIGKKREVKTEHVAVKDGPSETKERRQIAALSPYEKDGWVGYRDDLNNHHNSVRGKSGVYAVHFTRYVETA